MSQKQQFDLLEKYLSGTASAAEMAMVDQWIDQIHLNDEWDTYTDVQKKEMIEKMYSDIRKSIGKKGKIIPVSRRYSWLAAAASVVLLLIAGIWFWSNNPGKEKQMSGVVEQNSKVTDIHPGGNKATLTLADGSTIILDSANNGNITRQGNVTVIKLDDGQLSYHPSDNANAEVVYNTIATPRGGQYQVVLADGSKVWLNAASSITFPTSFPGKEREVKVTGEAYFEVVHNAAKPFRVSVGDMKVEVLGTHFNVNAYEDEGEIKTTLLEGSVNVSVGSRSVRITPGEEARIRSHNDNIEIGKGVNVDEVIAWKNGLFQFDQANIQTIMRQIARWYDVDVEFRGIISKETFTGIVSRNSNVSLVLEIMKQAGIKFKIEGRKIIVT